MLKKMLVPLALVALVVPVSADAIRHLQPYTRQTRYMSLAGFYRLAVHDAGGGWISLAEARRAVQ